MIAAKAVNAACAAKIAISRNLRGTKLWAPGHPNGCHIGLTSGHTFIVPGDKAGVEVPQRFRRVAIARGCIAVGMEPAATEADPFDKAAAIREAEQRRMANTKARDDRTHRAVPVHGAAVDPGALAQRETADNEVGDHTDAALRDRTANAVRLLAWLIDRCRIEEKSEIERRTVQNSGPNPLRNKRALDAALGELAESGRVRLFNSGRQKLIEVNTDWVHVATVATVDPLAEGVR